MTIARMTAFAVCLAASGCGDDGGSMSTPDAAIPVATALAFGTAPPATATVHAPISFTVEVHDENGALLTTDNTTVITISQGTGTRSGFHPFKGMVMQTVVGGVATFDGLSWPLAEAVTFDVTATGNVPQLADTTIAIAPIAYSKIVATDQFMNLVAVFDLTATGDVAPVRTITGAATTFNNPWGLAFDELSNEIIVANFTGQALNRFPVTATGDVAPTSSIVGAATTIDGPSRPWIDYRNDELMLGQEDGDNVLIFQRTASGDVAPKRVLTLTAGLDAAVVNHATDELYVAGLSAGTIFVYDRIAAGAATPKRTITGTLTQLSEPTRLVIDPVHNELIVFDGDSGILAFALDATGDVAPLRRLDGGATTITGGCEGGAYNPTTDEVIGACKTAGILVFNRTDTGDLAPKRAIKGAAALVTNVNDIALAP